MNKIRLNYLRQRQSLPLNAKIELTKHTINNWYNIHDGQVYVSFSGGRDSTVLLHITRSLFSDIPVVFFDTGNEYPEIISFVESIPSVIVIKPTTSLKQIVSKYGYPVINKESSQKIYEIRNTKSEKLRHKRLHGDNNKYKSGRLSLKYRYLIDAPFKISDRCCYKLKKEPAKKYEKQTGRHPILGNKTSDSHLRHQQYIKNTCQSLSTKRKICTPLSWWLDKDIHDYVKLYNVAISSIYDHPAITNTGCYPCLFGIQNEQPGDTKLDILRKLHPRLYKYCMDTLDYKTVLPYIYPSLSCSTSKPK